VNLWCYLGVLKISTVNTWAEIWVDGEFLDRTPRADPLILPLGKHLIELKNPAFKTWSKEYNFIEGAGEPQLIAVTMEPLIP
jgi:hypothetical protein